MFTLNTNRLTLRDLLEEDWPILHMLRSDPTVTKYIDYIKSDTEAESHQWVLDTMLHNAKEPRLSYNLTIIRQADQQILGWIGIGQASDLQVGDMDFAYALRPEFWGQGYATEALRALLNFAFVELGLTRIFGECDEVNVASARVMEKAGMKLSARIKPNGEEAESDEPELRYMALVSEWT